MNLTELARLAKVSVSTVSKAFSGSKEISESKRQEIFKIAKENNCYSKYIKISPYKYTIAVACPEFKSGLYSVQLSYLEEEVKKRGGIVLAATYNFDYDEKDRVVSYFLEQCNIDGMILYSNSSDNTHCFAPLVCISNSDIYDSIIVSYDSSMNEAIEYLAENEHTKIAYIGEPLAIGSYECFCNSMKKSGIPICEDYVITANDARFEEAGYEAMTKLLNLKNPPTAVIAAYDYIAFGAIKAITERGLKIPEDISVIGRDDVKECNYLNIPLTTITPYSKDLCEIVVDTLFRRIEGTVSNPPRKINVSSQLIKRGTVGKAKNSQPNK